MLKKIKRTKNKARKMSGRDRMSKNLEKGDKEGEIRLRMKGDKPEKVFTRCFFIRRTNKLLQNKSLLTVLVDEQGQVLSVVRADVEQHGRTLVGPEAQGDVLSSQRRVRVDGGRQSAAVPAQLVRLLEGVADGGVRLEAGRHLWRKRRRPHEVFFFLIC